MAQNVYECLFILDSNRYAREPGIISDKITEIIEKAGGEVLASRLWVEQKLAYPIDGHHKGTYWLSYFRLEGPQMPVFTRACKLEENIVRHMVIKLDPRLADVMVSYAIDGSMPADGGDDAPAADADGGDESGEVEVPDAVATDAVTTDVAGEKE